MPEIDKFYIDLGDAPEGDAIHAYTEHLDKIVAEVNQETDRGVALFSGSILDQVLADILSAFLVDSKETRALFKYPQPLSTFSARQNLCVTLGLISPKENEVCSAIRGIRNKFAHNIGYSISFKDKELKKFFDKFPMYENPKRFNKTDYQLGDYRNEFIMMVIAMHWIWTQRIEYARDNKRLEYSGKAE